MRLAHKLSLAQFALILAILVVHSAIRMHREVNLFESDMRRDHRVTGQALAASVAEIWRTSGREKALKLLADADAAEKEVGVGWVWLEGNETPGVSPHAEWAEPLRRGQEVER